MKLSTTSYQAQASCAVATEIDNPLDKVSLGLSEVCNNNKQDKHDTSNDLQQQTTTMPTNIPNDINDDNIFSDQSLLSKDAKQYIQSSLYLNFYRHPRNDFRDTTFPNIEIRPDIRLSKGMKWHIMVTAAIFDFHTLPLNDRILLAGAIGRREAYLAGYQKPPSAHTVLNWWKNYSCAKKKSTSVDTLFDSKAGKGRINYVTYLEREFPQYLHYLYRYATKTIGADATVPMLCCLMNSKSQMDHPYCPVRSRLKMTRHKFWTFFNLHGGVLKNPIAKPALTDMHKGKRLEFAKKQLKKAINHDKDEGDPDRKEYWRCYLDEKWMYTTSRRKQLKILPPAPWEDPEEVAVSFPKLRNRRAPCKVMYMGIVARPEPKYQFEGKIMLKRISKMRNTRHKSFNKKLTDDYYINDLIEHGHWKSLVPESPFPDVDTDIVIADLIQLMQDTYHFDNDIKS